MGGKTAKGNSLLGSTKRSTTSATAQRSASPRAVDTFLVFTVWVLLLDLNPFTTRTTSEAVVLAGVASLLQMGISVQRGRYIRIPRPSRTDEVATTLIATVIATASIPLVAELLNWNTGARELILGAVIVGFVLGVAGDVRRSRRRNLGANPVVIVGTGAEARELGELLHDHPETGLAVAGVVGEQRVAVQSGLEKAWLGPIDDVVEIMDAHGSSTALIAVSSFRSANFRHIVNTLLDHGCEVGLSSGVSRIDLQRHVMGSVVHEPVLMLEPRKIQPWQAAVKRSADMLGAAIGLILTGPLLLLAALAIRLEDGGPVLYRQLRIGRDGQPFSILKLRTMRVGADRDREVLEGQNERNGPLFKVSGDARITGVGKVLRDLSIDELPQLLNVLKGEMSLVGPRPALPSEVEHFDDELQSRARVRPGITGLWQVEARTNASFAAYRRLDLHYVDNWSLWLDFRILVATVQLVVVSATLKAARMLSRNKGARVDTIEPTVNAMFDFDAGAAQLVVGDKSHAAGPVGLVGGEPSVYDAAS